MNKYTHLTKLFGVILMSVFVSACTGLTQKRNNGSLNYQSSKLLPPIQIPANKQTQKFTQIYSTVDLGDSSIKMVNKEGSQYQLPAP